MKTLHLSIIIIFCSFVGISFSAVSAQVTSEPAISVHYQFSQMASSENNVYITYQENIGNGAGASVFFRKSLDAGSSFGTIIPLSIITHSAANPLVASSGNNVYVAWMENWSGIGNPFVIGMVSPLKQFKSGVKVQDVKCQPNYFILIIKAEDNSPACVKANTAFRLSELGWGYLSSPITSKIDLLDSKITGGTITEFNYDTQSASIIIKIQTTSNGILTVTIPKVLTDLSPHYLFKTYTILADGMETYINSGVIKSHLTWTVVKLEESYAIF